MKILGIQQPAPLFERKIDWQHHLQNSKVMEAALDVLKTIAPHGEAYIVGGAVRDLLMNKTPDDVDIATNLTPEEIEQIFPQHYDIGANKEFGIAVVKHMGFDFEIATYRKDIYQTSKGFGASGTRHTKSFSDDVSRRDLTINGLGLDKDGNIIDFVGGEKDITNQVIRTIGDPDLRFEEDFVRMLRAIRFASRMGFKIDPKTGESIKRHSEYIAQITPERIFKELKKMAEQGGNQFADAILMLKEYGLLKYILPEVEALQHIPHSLEKHPEGANVLDHIISALRQSKAADAIINLSILLHDIGKLITHGVDEKGAHSYFNHTEKAMDLIDRISDRLKLDNTTRNAIKFAALNHMKFAGIENMRPQKILDLMSSPYWDVLLKTAEAGAKSRVGLYHPEDWSVLISTLDALKTKYSDDSDPLKAIRKVINGDLVMKTLGIPPSKQVGEIITNVINLFVEKNIDLTNQDEIKKLILEVGKDYTAI